MADTMYAKRKVMLNDELDSLCIQRVPVLRQRAIDSMLIIEKDRIRELIE